VVIGAGAAGLSAAYLAAALKAKVTPVEKERMGGDCLNTGCVPPKASVCTCRLLAQIRCTSELGIREAHAEFEGAKIPLSPVASSGNIA
jgi:pyruvate/2-oxoglutarate dehydrogenase complex dihydrolipoamide dehydrogenase (E3) component